MYPYLRGGGKARTRGPTVGEKEVQYRCICLSGESNGTCAVCLSPRPRLLRAWATLVKRLNQRTAQAPYSFGLLLSLRLIIYNFEH